MRNYNQQKAPVKHAHRINQEITSEEVRLVTRDGETLGIVPLGEALLKAQEQGLDLVEMAPQAKPPVCKLMNYGKFLYMQSKQQRLHKAKQKKVELKALRLSLKIEKHDLETKLKQANKFLDQGHKVKIDMRLRGREKAFRDQARERMQELVDMFGQDVKADQQLKSTPQGFTVTLAKKA